MGSIGKATRLPLKLQCNSLQDMGLRMNVIFSCREAKAVHISKDPNQTFLP